MTPIFGSVKLWLWEVAMILIIYIVKGDTRGFKTDQT